LGKIVPLAYAKEKGLAKKNNEESELLRFSSISILLAVMAIIIEAYIIWKYIGKDLYANYSVLLLVLGLIGFTGVFFLNPSGIFNFNDYYMKDLESGLKFLSYILMLVVSVGVMMFVLNFSYRFALELVDLYLYYLAAAVIEELFFRMFLVNLLRRVKLGWFSIIISALIFMIAHWDAYGHSLQMMTAMFLGGIIFGAFYLLSKDITITMLGHLIINLISVGSLLVMA